MDPPDAPRPVFGTTSGATGAATSTSGPPPRSDPLLDCLRHLEYPVAREDLARCLARSDVRDPRGRPISEVVDRLGVDRFQSSAEVKEAIARSGLGGSPFS